MRSHVLLTGALAGNAAAQAVMGFNSGSTIDNYQVKQQADFEQEFTTARNLVGAPGAFTSVRLYTMVQGGTTSDPISAFPAAIKTNTTMLLGIWCSGTTTIQNDLDALSKAIRQYGDSFTKLVVGISVGSEDLYRNSVSGARNKAGIGANPDVLVKFITQVRNTIKGTPLQNVPVGHVDTWDVWGNSSNKAVVDAIDFLGTDAYPYYQDDKGDNSINAAKSLWDSAIASAQAAAGGKAVWITETGWPTSGPNWGSAQTGLQQAKQYWDQVGCSLFGKTNTWWYTLRDSNPANAAKFAITNALSTNPLFDLSCPAPSASSSAILPSGSGTSSAIGGSGTSSTTSGAGLATSGSGSSGSVTTGTGTGTGTTTSGTSKPASGGSTVASGKASVSTSKTSAAATSSVQPSNSGSALAPMGLLSGLLAVFSAMLVF